MGGVSLCIQCDKKTCFGDHVLVKHATELRIANHNSGPLLSRITPVEIQVCDMKETMYLLDLKSLTKAVAFVGDQVAVFHFNSAVCFSKGFLDPIPPFYTSGHSLKGKQRHNNSLDTAHSEERVNPSANRTCGKWSKRIAKS